jgi:fructosamine-3-kinase
MRQEVRAEIERVLGARVESLKPVTGGDINEAFRVDLSDKRIVFVKTNATADPEMFPAEAHGLRWLGESQALRTPGVIALSSGRAGEPAFIVLEWLAPGSPWTGFDESLGRGLAELHRTGASGFGLDRDYFIGRLPQINTPCDSWAEFYRSRRLAPLIERAGRSGALSGDHVRRLERLLARLEELVGPAEPPARLHGDLWGGNLYVDRRGGPCLVDPAAYGGHREIDLAMMKLFGGFSITTFAAYHETFPLAPGHERRVALYQLYPLLVHVNLFGGTYVNSVEQALAHYE